MAKPIKERGIKWTETYGDKSQYLKREMEDQIGPGSYFRWEGHDSTTGTDYYVVVSPGYSPKHGYHFFAGLRKMPADHGASGKEFNSMREALNYAYDMWRVPKPDTMPPGWVGYRQEDITGKDIVLEGVHASSEKPVKTGMAVQTMRSQVDTRLGSQITPAQYCEAYAASPITGFLPALYSNLRFIGVDGQNFDPKLLNKTENRLRSGDRIPGDPKHETRKDERPPLLATCQEPNEEIFNEHMQGTVTAERLYTMPENFGRNELEYPEFMPALDMPMADEGETAKVKTYRWGNIDARMSIGVPSEAVDEDFLSDWQDIFYNEYVKSLSAQRDEAVATGAPDQFVVDEKLRALTAGDPSEQPGKADMIMSWTPGSHGISDYNINVMFKARNMDVYNRFKEELEENVNGIFERIRQQHIAAGGKPEAPIEYKLKDNPHGVATRNLVKLYNRANLIRERALAPADPNDKKAMELKAQNQKVMKKHGLENGFDFDQVYMQKVNVEGSQMFIYRDDGLPHALEADQEATTNWMQEEAKERRIGVRYILKDPVAYVDRFEPGFAQSWAEDPQGELAQQYLKDFQEKAAANAIPMSHADFLDYRTVPPLLTNPKTTMPSTDQFRIPADPDGDVMHHEKVKGLTEMPMREADMVKPYVVEATRDQDRNGKNVFAARWWDPQAQQYVYDQLPPDVELGVRGEQRFDGVPTINPSASMQIQDASGKTQSLRRNEFMMYDPSGCGKFIPNHAFDINMKSKAVSSYGKFKEHIGLSDGYAITKTPHKAQISYKTGELGIRQGSASEFSKSVPKIEGMDPKDYTVEEGTGKNKRFIVTDNLPAMMWLKKKLFLDDHITYPFTRMTTMDNKVIQEHKVAGQSFYKKNKARFEKYASEEDAVAAGEDPEQYRQYVYGKTVSECSDKNVPPEVFKTLANELKNPEKAFSPKEGELWGIWTVPPGKSDEEGEWYVDGNLGPVLSKSELGAKYDIQKKPIQKLKQAQWAVSARRYEQPGGKNFMLPSLATSKDKNPVYVYEAKETSIVDYLRAAAGPAEDEEEVEEMPPEQPEEAEQPEEQLVPAAPTGPQYQEEPGEPEGPEVQPGSGRFETPPVVPQQPDFGPGRWQVPEIEPEPRPPLRLPPGPPPKRKRVPIEPSDYMASTINKLVKMANDLDKRGRTKEADVVDKAIRKISERIGSA